MLEITDLVFEAPGRRVLDGLSFSIPQGLVHAALGPNGSGKSTLAYLIMGCEGYQPTSGEMFFNGVPLRGLKLHERAALGITLSWQEPVRFEGITVAEYLSVSGRGQGLSPEICLKLVGLEPAAYLCRQVDRSLSGGERKRVELASVLAFGPTLAVLDEPDSGIDMLSLDDISNMLAVLKEGGGSVLLITHRREVAMAADMASLICRGRVACTGRPEGVAEYYRERRCIECGTRECVYV